MNFSQFLTFIGARRKRSHLVYAEDDAVVGRLCVELFDDPGDNKRDGTDKKSILSSLKKDRRPSFLKISLI